MRSKSLIIWVALLLSVVTVANVASATIVQGIDIEFVTIGNAGNVGEQSRLASHGDTTYYGGVNYEYQIGKYEVTNAQWDQFTSAVGAPTGNPAGAYNHDAEFTGALLATDRVSWYEALQFCNYLTSGDKSLGAYQFSGDNTNPGDFVGINRASAISAYGTVYVIPTEDEWYKAAYYTASGYSLYANGTSTAPVAGVDTNYNMVIGQPWEVGTGTEEQNGTFDMMGNLWEWDEAIVGTLRGARGGGYYEGSQAHTSSYRFITHPHYEMDIGFRVASTPEPATFLLLGFGLVLLRRA